MKPGFEVSEEGRGHASNCLDDDALGAFLEDRLDFASMARIDQHASSCTPCRELIALGARVAVDSMPPNQQPRVSAGAIALPPKNQRRVGAMLKDKWRLDAVVGVGGMAEVYAGTHRNGKKVAVKVLLPQLTIDPELCRRFVQEGYIANHVDHPGVVAVHDNDVTDDGAPFLVMDLLEGECIADTIDRGRVFIGEAVRIARSVLETLAAAHEKGVLHRDVKPGNIFRTTKGDIKLLDFGIARVDSSTGARTMTGATMGTPAFMPPEQARGATREVDERSDVWAVGATLFTMLTTQKVRDAETNNEMLVLAMMHPVRSILETADWIPRELAAIIDKSLAFERADRWTSAREMAAALAALPASALHDPGNQVTIQRRPAQTYVVPTVATPTPAWEMRGGGAGAVSPPPNFGPSLFERRRGSGPPSAVFGGVPMPMLVGGGALAALAALVIAAIILLIPAPHPKSSATATNAVSSTTILTSAATESPPPPAAPVVEASSANTDTPAPATSTATTKRKTKSVTSSRAASSAPAPVAAPARAGADPYDRRL